MASDDRLFKLLDDIASSLMMVEDSSSDELSSVRENLEEICSTIQVLLGLEEENKELRKSLEILERIDSKLDELPSEPVELEEALENLTVDFDQVEILLGDYSRGVESGNGGSEEAPGEEQIEVPGEEDFNTDPESYDEELFFDFYSEASEHLRLFENNLLTLEDNPGNTEAINENFRAIHSIKGMAGFLNFKFINRISHKMENLLDLFREGIKVDQKSIDLLLKGLDLLKNLVNLHRLTVETGEQQSLDIEQVRDLEADLDPVLKELKEKGKKAERAEEFGERAEEPVQLKESRQIRVDLEKIDRLVNMTGELVTTFHQLKQQDTGGVKSTDNKIMNQLDRVIGDLQDDALALRMVPLQKSFNKIKRLVHDLAREFGKEINLEIQGAETELDRTLVEKIQDPLVHLVRNAIDHGLETPDERKEAGKNPAGNLTLAAYHESGNVIIEISDDGRGLNKEKIISIAEEKNIISNPDELSDEEIYHLIFEPGFSTSEEVTDVSGRGVGMDVVNRNIQEINGAIEIESTPGEGSTFRMKIPLTLSIISGMMIKVGEQRFILPTLDIRQSLRPRKEQITTVEKKGEVLNVRGEIITVLRLGEIFDVENCKKELTESMAVIVYGTGNPVALVVDDLLGQQEVVIKKLDESFQGLKGVSGAAILGDGNVGLILDSQELSKTYTFK